MKLRAAADSKAWEPQTPTLLFDYIADFLRAGKQEMGSCEEGLRVQKCFDALVKECEVLQVLRQFGEWELVLYLLRTFTRAVTADPRYCELLYMCGLGNTGKDVIGLLFMSFFGFSDIHYGVMAPPRN